MSNFAAALSIQLQYTGPSGNQINIPPITVSAEYQAQNAGVIDVPDATASATSYAVPFGAIDDLTTCGIILNQTGQPLELKVNGAAAASQTIPDGGVYLWGFPNSTGAIPTLSASLKTTAMQTGTGYIAYYLFGDPV